VRRGAAGLLNGVGLAKGPLGCHYWIVDY